MSSPASRSTPRKTPRRPKKTGRSPITSEAQREQALRDYKVTIEYKHLKQHSPGGVYVLPSLDSLRLFHGVIFVRRGLFSNGIFKFQVELPQAYNDINAYPKIIFTSYVFNPHVNDETGELDLPNAYPTWDPQRHYLVTAFTYLKKVFYMKTFGDHATANIEAREMARNDFSSYRKKVESCVRESQRSVYVNEPNCTAKFAEENACHILLRDLMKQRMKDPNLIARQQILDCVKESMDAVKIDGSDEGLERIDEEVKEDGAEGKAVDEI